MSEKTPEQKIVETGMYKYLPDKKKEEVIDAYKRQLTEGVSKELEEALWGKRGDKMSEEKHEEQVAKRYKDMPPFTEEEMMEGAEPEWIIGEEYFFVGEEEYFFVSETIITRNYQVIGEKLRCISYLGSSSKRYNSYQFIFKTQKEAEDKVLELIEEKQ